MNTSPHEIATQHSDLATEKIEEQPARHSFFCTPIARISALVLLFSVAAILECIYLTALGDYDIWFHLQTGNWILSNHAIPHIGLFSQYSTRTWMAYSWGFELLTALAYRLLGLMSLPLLLIGFHVALAVILFRLARITQLGFWPSVFLSAAGQLAVPNLEMRPSFVSILFYGIALILLFQSRNTGSARPLFWLPPLFLLWANLHIQFVYGIIVLAIFCTAAVLEALGRRWGWLAAEANLQTNQPAVPLLTIVLIGGISALAPLLSPYSYHLYQIAWQYSHSAATYSYIAEMHAMSFRLPQHYLRLLLVMAAAVAVGYRRSREIFPPLLLAICALLAFRAQRDVWVVVLPAVALIAESFATSHEAKAEEAARPWRWEQPLTAALVTLVLLIAVLIYIPHDREKLLHKVNEVFPVEACNAIKEHHLPAPIYNPLNWGGFLTWYMPEYAVSIDGRTDLYGDEILARQFQVMNGERSPLDEPTFRTAQTFLLPKNTALAWEMSRSPHYRMVYRDERALIFVPLQ